MSKGEKLEFYVQCINCGSFWAAVPKSPQWWRAKKRHEDGYLDAIGVKGEVCGCIKKQDEPDAPFRVFGFGTEYGEELDQPFHRFTEAVTAYRNGLKSGLLDIWISGVSKPVESRLRDLRYQ